MSVPVTGFNPTPANQPSEAVPLPLAHELNYADGGVGPFQALPEDFAGELETVVLSLGDIILQKEFGFNSQAEFGFNIRLVQRDAYGIVLLDYVNPPALEQFVQLGG